MTERKEGWFETWFDTSYYHILYQNRDFVEAERFITNLLAFLKLPAGSNCLDLACGKGRHSVFLNKHGLKVTGVDLSENSINEAKTFENETLTFDVHDMSTVYKKNEYDTVFNLFTSFGYFDDYEVISKVRISVKELLVVVGQLLIDFWMAVFVLVNWVKEEEKTLVGLNFIIMRIIEGINFFKNIHFTDKGKEFNFQEKVQAIKKEEFEDLLEKVGFEVQHVFGDFSLAQFDRSKSDRLIIIAEKK